MGSLLVTLIGSVADWLIHLCNQISRNYRLVAHKLDGELRVEKERIQVREREREIGAYFLSIIWMYVLETNIVIW